MTDSISNTSSHDVARANEGHVSEAEAIRSTQQDDVPELVDFIGALKMRRPISTDMAAGLLTHLVMQQRASDASEIADQMRAMDWASVISDDETLPALAQRVLDYLAIHEGIALFNFFVRTFAKTSGQMFEPPR